ncbi:MAG: hypothetical protein M3R38_05970 [Actinomycetota bacterium]|nr:hypothetical protein [Actinomycetota bacterium]
MPPVELTERRSRDAKHYDNGDGTFTAVISPGAHYRDASGAWFDCDPKWRAVSRSEWVSDTDSVRIRVYSATAKGTTAWWLELTGLLDGAGVRFKLPQAPAAPTSGGRALTYDDPLLGAGWTYTLTRGGVKLVGPPVGVRLGARTYSYPYETVGGGTPLASDGAGNLVSGAVTIRRATVRGADGEDYLAGPWTATAATVSFAFDDAEIPLPYQVDPTTTFAVAASGDDRHVNRVGTAYPPAGTISVSATTVGIAAIRNNDPTLAAPFTIRNGLFRWDTSSIPDTAQITGARFVGFVVTLQNGDARSLTMDWFTWDGTTADYSEVAQTNAHAGTAIGSLTLDADNVFELDNAAANINKTGLSFLRSHISGGQPTGKNVVTISAFDDTTAGRGDPRLLVDYTTTTTVPLEALTASATTPAPTVSPGAVQANLAALEDSSFSPAPSVTPGAVSVALEALVGTGVAPAPSVVSGSAQANLESLVGSSFAPVPSVAPGPVSVALGALALSAVSPAPVVASSVSVALGVLPLTATSASPAVAPGPVSLGVAAQGLTGVPPPPTVTGGAASVALDSLTATITAPAPIAAGVFVALAALSATSVTPAPTATGGAALVALGALPAPASSPSPYVAVGTPAPPWRTTLVRPENRAVAVPLETRARAAAPERRVRPVETEARTIAVAPEKRTAVIPNEERT